MLRFKLTDQDKSSDSIIFFGRKIKVLMGIVKVAFFSNPNEKSVKTTYLFYFFKQRYITIIDESNTSSFRIIIQLVQIKQLEFEKKRAILKFSFKVLKRSNSFLKTRPCLKYFMSELKDN